jgi:predicted DNA-binding transcriptional regulator YafY
MRWKNLTKLIKTITLLSSSTGVTIEELSTELKLDRRSIYRVFADLEELGFPLYDDQELGEKKKTWRLDAGYVKKLPNVSLPDISLNMGEMLALCMAASQSTQFIGTEIGDALKSSFHKLGLLLPEGLLPKLSRFQVLFHGSGKYMKDYKGKEALIEKLATAMFNQTTCQVKYNSFSQKKNKVFDIDPLCFVNHEGGLYAYVRSSYGNIIILAVERLLSLKVSDQRFEYPEDFDAQDYLDASFGIMMGEQEDIQIVFAKKVAPYIKERRWAKEQHVIENPDGSIILNIKAPITWEIISWILSFGPSSYVLGPKALKKEVKAAVNQVWVQY